MGRKAKCEDPVNVSARLPRAFVESKPSDKNFSDWLREDKLRIDYYGNPIERDNAENPMPQTGLVNGQREALRFFYEKLNEAMERGLFDEEMDADFDGFMEKVSKFEEIVQ